MIDSLQLLSRIDTLQNQIISLRNATSENSIAKEYFTTIISTQTGIFAVIVGLIGLVSIGSVFYKIQKLNKELTLLVNERISSLQLQFDNFKTKMETDLADFENELRVNEFDVYRAFSIISQVNKEYNISFIWAIRILDLNLFQIKRDEETIINTQIWLHEANKLTPILSYSKFTKAEILEIQEVIIKTKNEIINEIKNDELLSNLELCEKDFFARYYKVTSKVE